LQLFNKAFQPGNPIFAAAHHSSEAARYRPEAKIFRTEAVFMEKSVSHVANNNDLSAQCQYQCKKTIDIPM